MNRKKINNELRIYYNLLIMQNQQIYMNHLS